MAVIKPATTSIQQLCIHGYIYVHVHVHVCTDVHVLLYVHVHNNVSMLVNTVQYRISKNHNSLGCEQPLGLDVNQSPDAQSLYACTANS